MQLSRFTDYSLRVLILLAHRRDRLTTIREIAAEQAISEAHLMKIVHHLAKCGYIVTVRGKGGGMQLARDPGQINLGALVRDTEETLSLVECLKQPYDGQCRLYGGCRLMRVLSDAQAAFLGHLDSFTLADLVTPSDLPAEPVVFEH